MTERVSVGSFEKVTEEAWCVEIGGGEPNDLLDGHALTRAVVGSAAGRLPVGEQEAEDTLAERGRVAQAPESESADPQTGSSGSAKGE